MIILRKKRLIVIMLCIAFLVSIVIVKKSMDNKGAVQVVALPINNKVIVIDSGHGLPDGGSVGNNGTLESDINLQIALKVQSLLEQSGTTVILTRSDENGISELENATIRQKHAQDLKNRVKIGNESSADIFVSIHLNKISDTKTTGWQTFYRKEDEASIKLANSIQNSLNETIQKKNTKEPNKISGIYIVEHVEIPITIAECGFLSNTEEEQLLNTEEYQNKLAWGIYTGIINYFYEE